jgi:hypothetical protein
MEMADPAKHTTYETFSIFFIGMGTAKASCDPLSEAIFPKFQ